MEMYRRTLAEINLDQLLSNWESIRLVANDDRFICPMVKANAYGHGDVQVSLALEKAGVEQVGVCLIEEGLLLRASGFQKDILVFRGFDKIGAEKILDNQMVPVVSTWEQLAYLEELADEPVKIHLKINTGMNRIGFNPDQAEKLMNFFKKSKRLKLKALLTHFACGEDALSEGGFSAQQTKKFNEVLDYFSSFDIYAHLLNSGGIACLDQVLKATSGAPDSHFLTRKKWGFRPGLMLYGYQPSEYFKLSTVNSVRVKPVMTLKSVVNNIRQVAEGESVSYGCTWKAQKASQIAVVPIGYADGVHRLLSNKGQALFAGQVAPIVGRICMDFLMLDVTEILKGEDPSRWIEEEVVLFGYDEQNHFLTADDAARCSESIVWETLTSVGERVPRQFVHKGLKG